jgi:hypothetical protein
MMLQQQVGLVPVGGLYHTSGTLKIRLIVTIDFSEIENGIVDIAKKADVIAGDMARSANDQLSAMMALKDQLRTIPRKELLIRLISCWSLF